MVSKKLLAIGLSVVLVSSVTTVMASGLTLKSSGITDPVQVTCNGKQLPSQYELTPNRPVVPDLPWVAVSAAFDFASDLDCKFTLDNKTHDLVGTAHLTLGWTTGEATNVKPESAYAVTVTPGENTATDTMTVELRKK